MGFPEDGLFSLKWSRKLPKHFSVLIISSQKEIVNYVKQVSSAPELFSTIGSHSFIHWGLCGDGSSPHRADSLMRKIDSS